jgi:hypothetical protein
MLLSRVARKTKRKWALLQARIDIEPFQELTDLARQEGLPNSAYLRRLVLQHLESMKKLTPVLSASI